MSLYKGSCHYAKRKAIEEGKQYVPYSHMMVGVSSERLVMDFDNVESSLLPRKSNLNPPYLLGLG